MRVKALSSPLRPGIAIAIVLAVLTAAPGLFAQEELTPLVSSRERFTKANKRTDAMFFGSFGSPAINDKGNVTFFTTVYGRKVDRATNSTICLMRKGKPVMIARENITQYTQTGSTTSFPIFGLGLTPQINKTTRVAWAGKIDNGEVRILIALSNQKGRSRVFPGRQDSFITSENIDVNAKGRVALRGDLEVLDDDGNLGVFETLWRRSAQRAQAVISEGEVPIGMPLGTTFESFGIPTIDDNDNLYYVADISDKGSQFDGIWYGRTADGIPLATIEDASPGGANFVSFQDPPVPSDDGKLCAFAASTDAAQNTGVWLVNVQTGRLTEVAVEGTQVFGGALAAFQAAAVNNSGTVAFMAKIGNRDGIVAGKPGNLRTVVTRATNVLVNGKRKRIIDLRFDPVGGLNNLDQVAFTASFNDRSSGVFVVQL